MTNEFISQFLAQFLLYAIGVVVLYLNQRAINKANQDDIRKLTKITEETKKEFTDKTEELKAQLHLNNQHKLNIKTVERDAIFDYNKSMQAWFLSVSRFPIDKYTLDTYTSIMPDMSSLRKYRYDTDMAESHLHLFMPEKDFVVLAVKLALSISHIESILKDKLFAIHRLYNVTKKKEAESATALPAEVYLRMQDDILNEIKDLTAQSTPITEKIYEYQKQFNDMAIKRIKQLEE